MSEKHIRFLLKPLIKFKKSRQRAGLWNGNIEGYAVVDETLNAFGVSV